MTTRLNLQADRPGRFFGQSAHYSGEGFSDMKFAVEALPEGDWAAWAAGARGQGQALDARAYQALAQRGVVRAPVQYGAVDGGLFDSVVRLSAPPAELPHTAGKSRVEG